MYNLFFFSYLEFILGVREQEGKQLMIGEYDACHTTGQLFNTSLYFSLNTRICKTRFVIKQWKGIGRFYSVSKKWGLVGVMSVILACRKIISIAPAQGRFIRECCGVCFLLSAVLCASVSVWGCRMGPSCSFRWELFCVLINEGVAQSM